MTALAALSYARTFEPFVRLHRQQSVWRFSGVLRPPLDTGMMWSTSSKRCGSAATETLHCKQA